MVVVLITSTYTDQEEDCTVINVVVRGETMQVKSSVTVWNAIVCVFHLSVVLILILICCKYKYIIDTALHTQNKTSF